MHPLARKACLQKKAQCLVHLISGIQRGCLILTVLISGCAMVGPDYVKPTTAEPEKWLQYQDPRIQSKPADDSRWWMVFKDPILDELVESAYQQNLPLQIAALRILEARAQLGIAIGFQFPQQQQIVGRGSVSQLSKNAPNSAAVDRYFLDLQVGLDAAWELDIWGKFRRAVQTGVANLEASMADYDDVLVTLTAEVARTYIALRTSEERLAVAHQNVEVQKRSLQIAEVRFNAGTVTELDVTQARALLRTTESTIPGFESDIRQAKNALAILLGKLPGEIDAVLAGPGFIPQLPAEATVGIPAELLRRRPDIRFAERALAAQSARIGFAKADLFPAFSLFGFLGFQAADKVDFRSNNAKFSDLFKTDSITYFAGPNITWNFLNYGRITNQVRVQDARFQELAANYENTVLRAAGEVEDAMVAFLRSQDAVALLAEAVNASKRSVELALIQYREGLTDFQRVLDAQRFSTQQQDILVATTGAVGLNLVSIYKSLGGGWEIRQDQNAIPAATQEEMRKRTNWGNLLSIEEPEPPPAEDVKAFFHRPDW
jgi:NodT family efflux transporter outer membrane factor (OMF) lipoprotein